MSNILKRIGTFLLAMLGQKATQDIILDILTKYTKSTENTVDDNLVKVVRVALQNEKDTEALSGLLTKWQEAKDQGSVG